MKSLAYLTDDCVGPTDALSDVLGLAEVQPALVASHTFARRQKVETVLGANLYTQYTILVNDQPSIIIVVF